MGTQHNMLPFVHVGLPFVHRGIEKIKYSVILSTYHGVTKNNAKVNDVIKVTNYSSSTKLACFSSHEARGTGSVAKYLAETF